MITVHEIYVEKFGKKKMHNDKILISDNSNNNF